MHSNRVPLCFKIFGRRAMRRYSERFGGRWMESTIVSITFLIFINNEGTRFILPSYGIVHHSSPTGILIGTLIRLRSPSLVERTKDCLLSFLAVPSEELTRLMTASTWSTSVPSHSDTAATSFDAKRVQWRNRLKDHLYRDGEMVRLRLRIVLARVCLVSLLSQVTSHEKFCVLPDLNYHLPLLRDPENRF